MNYDVDISGYLLMGTSPVSGQCWVVRGFDKSTQ